MNMRELDSLARANVAILELYSNAYIAINGETNSAETANAINLAYGIINDLTDRITIPYKTRLINRNDKAILPYILQVSFAIERAMEGIEDYEVFRARLVVILSNIDDLAQQLQYKIKEK